jgi:hypothetical protein
MEFRPSIVMASWELCSFCVSCTLNSAYEERERSGQEGRSGIYIFRLKFIDVSRYYGTVLIIGTVSTWLGKLAWESINLGF